MMRFGLACFLLLFLNLPIVAEEKGGVLMQTIKPEISRTPLLNPGKGWVLYNHPRDHQHGSMPYGTVGYTRFQWQDLEPEEGKYNWQPIDDFIKVWQKEGKQVAFGVMNASIHYRGKYVTPKWVFDAGCVPREVEKERPKNSKDVAAQSQYEGAQVIPANWIDPVYLTKVKNFLKALAKRYDGHPSLAWYEIRSYGNWGEGHLWPWRGKEPTRQEIFEHHIKLHRDIFKKTPLMAAETYFRNQELQVKAGKIGVGVRDDGVMSFRDGSTTADSDGLAPSAFEWGGTYQQFTDEGLWVRKGRRLEDCIRNGHVYYCGFARFGANDIRLFAQNEKKLIDRLTNLMGYHLVIDTATLPKEIRAGGEFPLQIKWRNDGVARIWFPCSVAVALIDETGKVTARTVLAKSHPQKCPGGQAKTEKLSAVFADVPVGTYRLAIGLFRDRSSGNPDIKLGLKHIHKENWHPIAKVEVIRD